MQVNDRELIAHVAVYKSTSASVHRPSVMCNPMLRTLFGEFSAEIISRPALPIPFRSILTPIPQCPALKPLGIPFSVQDLESHALHSFFNGFAPMIFNELH